MEHDNDKRAENLVRNEVFVCLSSLVSTLASSAGLANRTDRLTEAEHLCEQAAELCAPLLDYEEAATQHGFERSDAGHLIFYPKDGPALTADTWEEACEVADIDPYEREVYEHWAVSKSLAEDLAEIGEKVDMDFANMCVWARTTTGQGIAMDSAIRNVLALIDKRIADLSK